MEEVMDFKIIAIITNFPDYRNIEMQEECFHEFYKEEIKKITKNWREEFSLIFGTIGSLGTNKKNRNMFFGELEHRLRGLRANFKNILNKYNAEGFRFKKEI
jgi:hypothetical protein